MKLDNINNYTIFYRLHASKRMFERKASDNDIEYLLKNGEIIAYYDDDYPLPSLLISGNTTNNRSLHLVVAINAHEKQLVIITVYEPDPLKWFDNFSRRKT